MNDLISCIITTYNRKSTIKRAIDSVLNQTYKNIELIIVDDASTDGTLEYVEQLYDDDERIVYILNDNNTGVSEARNIGINAAKGNWIAINDSDDEWLPQKLEKQAALIDDNDPEIGLIYCQWKVFFQDGRSFEFPTKDTPDWFKSGKIFLFLLHSTLVSTQTLLFRKDYFYEVGGFDKTVKAAVDWEFCTRLAYKYKLILCDEVLVNVYESKGSVSKDRRETLRTYCRVYNKYYPLIKKAGYYDDSIRFLWGFAENSCGIHNLEDFHDMVCLDERSTKLFEDYEEKRRDAIFAEAQVKVAVFIDDSWENDILNFRRIEKMNPFFYCEQKKGEIDYIYNLMMLIRLLSKRDNHIAVTVYHTDERRLYPWEVKSVVVSSEEALSMKKDYFDQDIIISNIVLNGANEIKILTKNKRYSLPMNEYVTEENICDYEDLFYKIR